MKQFNEFLARAKKKTYATVFTRPKKVPLGGRQYSFREGPYQYQDTYYGEYLFSGQEIVLSQGKLMWSMEYRGGVSKEEKRRECYGFLRSCLKKIPLSFPARGPKEYAKGDWKYENKWTGDISSFEGKETISYKGEEIYSLKYQGGMLKN